jgi:PAS domain S-box-containing protein
VRDLLAAVREGPFILWAVDERGICTLSEGRGLSRVGLKPGEFVGSSVLDPSMSPPEHIEAVRRALRGEVFTADSFHNGIWWQTRFSPRLDADGRPRGVLAVSVDTTDWMAAVELGRKQVRQFEQLSRTVPGLIFRLVAHADGLYELDYVNDVGVRWMGLRAEPGRREPLERVVEPVHPEDQPRAIQSIRRAVQESAPLDLHVRIRLTGGEYRRFHSLAQVSARADGAVVFDGFVLDEEVRLRTSEALAERDALVRAIADAAPSILYVYDLVERRNIYANRQLTEVLGYDRADLERLSPGVLQALLHPEDLPRYAEHERSLHGAIDGQVVTFDYRMMHKDGRYRWLSSRELVFRRDESGRPKQVVGAARDVTEIKNALRELERREAELTLIADSMPALIAFIDSDGRYRFNNRTYELWLGRPRGELFGKTVREVFGEQFDRDVSPYYAQALSGRHARFERRIRGADGLERIADIDLVPAFEGERVIGYYVLGIDLTARKAAEQALQDSRERLALLVRRSPIGIIQWDQDFRVREWNPAAAEIFGYSAEEARGMHASAIIPPDIRPAIAELWKELTSRTGGERSRNENLTKDGRTILCEWYNTPLVGDAGLVLGASSMVRDVTLEARAEEELAKRESDLRSITNAIPALVASIGPDLRYRFGNHAHAGLAGIEPGELPGREVSEVLGAAFAQRLAPLAAEAIAGRQATGEARLVDRSGRQRELEIAVIPQRLGERVDGFYLMGYDVTDRNRDRRELAQYRDHLQQLVEERTSELARSNDKLRHAERLASVGTLAAGLGHDMNNMLLPMSCLVETLQGSASPEQRGELASVHRSLQFLRQLASGLLALASTPDQAASPPPRTKLHEWWGHDGPMILGALPSSVRLRVDLPEDLPPVAILADHLTRIVLNLMVNATEAGGDRAAISLWARRHSGDQGTFVALGVRDDGPGMSPEVLRHALDPFFTTKKRGLATGLGLSLVHAMIGAAGGSLQIDSAPGQGTSIVLLLPIQPHGSGAAGGRGQRLARVSIADERVAGFLRLFLQAHGLRVLSPEEGGLKEPAIWLMDPVDSQVLSARQFLIQDPSRRVLVFGRAGPAWRMDGVRVIADPGDIESIVAALHGE